MQMTRKKRSPDKHLSSRLRHILTDLERITVAEGFLHLDTATLAKRLRCSKRALYTLAPTQEQLLTLVIERVLDRTDQYLARAAHSAPGWRPALTTYMSAIVQTSRPASPGFLRDIAAFPPGMRLLNRLQRRTTHRLEQIIHNGTAAGEFNDISPRLVAGLILMAAGRLIDPDFLRNLGLTLAEAYEELSRLLDHGLLPQRELADARSKPGEIGSPARKRRVRSIVSPANGAGTRPRRRRAISAVANPKPSAH
jgi:AcrR family transcriptional regulator